MLLLLLASARLVSVCQSDLGCSLNGVCSNGACICDKPWYGARCHTLVLAPGQVGVGGIPLCAYHGDTINSTSWGMSVLKAPEDGKYYAWVASMANGCPLVDWETNSEVVLAVSTSPLGPFEKIRTLVPPWAHNPQTIRAPDAARGHVYALYTLGDGKNYHGAPKSCAPPAPGPPRPPAPPVTPNPPWVVGNCTQSTPHGGAWAGCITANFTIFWSDTPNGTYAEHTAQIVDWPVHRTGRPWDYGAIGNWNPAPIVHPNGTVFLLVHPEQFGFKHGEAILRADTWRGPYRLVAADTFASWRGSTANAEDPFMWIDKRGHWHILYEGNPMPGAHAYSVDGIAWSNISMANSGPSEGAFNDSRPFVDAQGRLANVSYYTERPKLLFGPDGFTPTHVYGGAGPVAPSTSSFTVVSPLSLA